MIYVLYVSSYLPRPTPTSLRKRAVLELHLPLHLPIILLLEGMPAVRFVIVSDECTGLRNILTFYVRTCKQSADREHELTFQTDHPDEHFLGG